MNRFRKHKTGLLIGFMVIATATYIVVDVVARTQKVQSVQRGKQMVGQYCGSCHMVPEPVLLPKAMWDEGVLPRMGPFLGITSFRGKPYYRANDAGAPFFPAKPVLNIAQWTDVVNYYLATAPEVLPAQSRSGEIKKELPFFAVELPPSKFFYGRVSMTSYIKIDTTVTPHRILVNDGINNRFLLVNNQLNYLNGFATHGPVVDLAFQPHSILATIIGKNPEANNRADGEVINISINNKAEVRASPVPLFNKLARPVKTIPADLNYDGRTDYIIAQFGNLVGDLSWMENVGNGKYKTHLLRKAPGALGAIVYDYNHDGLPDIYAQFAQGDEGIFLFTNKGRGVFEEKRILKFPPTYGSTSFEWVDMNKDGYPDIIYTCGDNGDYTPVLKPYHGVYIYLNDGRNSFTKQYFYPINGCNKAIARDFDGDGLVDIAAVSFYPSSAQPEEAFIYLQNKGKLTFQGYSLPAGTPFQKGITMDAGDLDGDGKPDLVLGNGYYTTDSTSTHKEPLFLVLKNRTLTKK